jgi:hypothetical protein
MPLPTTYLDRHMTTPCTVHVREATGQTDEHNNPTYGDDSYQTHVYCQQQQRMETVDGRASEQAYLVILNAADVFSHAPMDAFSWLEINGLVLELDGAPAVLTSMRDPGRLHHVEVLARANSTAAREA